VKYLKWKTSVADILLRNNNRTDDDDDDDDEEEEDEGDDDDRKKSGMCSMNEQLQDYITALATCIVECRNATFSMAFLSMWHKI
jgi:TATA-binding protein-associated factor Taf7